MARATRPEGGRKEGAITAWTTGAGEKFAGQLGDIATTLRDRPEYLVSTGPLGVGAALSKGAMADLFMAGKTIAQIAREAGTSAQYVSKVVNDIIKTGNKPGFTSDTWRERMVEVPGFPLATKASPWTSPQINRQIVELYNNGYSFKEIAEEVNAQQERQITRNQVSSRIRQINAENKRVDKLREEYGPRHSAPSGFRKEALDAELRYREKRGWARGEKAAFAKELGVSQAMLTKRIQRLQEEADPEAAMDRDLAKRVKE